MKTHPLNLQRIVLPAILCFLALAPARADFPARPNFVLRGIQSPYAFTVSDLNGDGRPDLAVSSWARLPGPGERYDHARDRVLIFYGKAGRFALPPDRSLAVRAPWTLLAGDFDRDGRTDLAVKEVRRRLDLLLGAENFQTLHTSTDINDSCRYAAAGRLGPGGLADFLCGPVWRKWFGANKFSDGYCYGPRGNDNRLGRVADLDGDGAGDMIFLAPKAVRLYYGPFLNPQVRPAEVARFVEIPLPATARDACVADLTGDGRPDLAVAVQGRRRSVLIYRQNAPAGFTPGQTPATEIRNVSGQLVAADLNRDGRTDLVVADSATRNVYIFMQRKNRALAAGPAQAYQTLAVRPYAVAAADVNGDGFPDLGVSDGRSTLAFFLNDGADHPERGGRRTPPPPPRPTPPPHPGKRKKTATPENANPADAVAPLQAALPAPLPPPRPGRDYQDPERMPFYTGAILPTPQKVHYKDIEFPLDHAAVVIGPGVRPAKAFLRLLRDRIEHYGGALEPADSPKVQCSTLLLLGKTPWTQAYLHDQRVPNRPQGYLMLCRRDPAGRPVVVLAAHDRLGLAWAVSSFNQLVHDRQGRPVLRAADVFDYPAILNRGFIAGQWPDAGRYCLAFKINKPVLQSALADYSIRDRRKRAESWRNPLAPKVRKTLRRYADWFSPFGIQWYAGQNPIACQNKIRSADEKDFQTVLGWACTLEALGGHLCLKYDDQRFPISPADQKRFGSARAADVYLLTRLIRELKSRYPNAKLLFCPPFYWGPSSPAPYPEPRDAYLYAIGKLPEQLEIFWTGPRVKSTKVTRDMVQWIVKRIRRKPVYWQNAFGAPHMFTYHYVTDPIRIFRSWFYPGFFQDVDAYLFNCMMPGYAAAAAACADYCWNPRAYDAEKSIAEAARKLVGTDTYPALAALNRALSYFDPFGLRRTPGAARKLPEMKRRLALVNRVWADIQQRNIAAVRRWTGMERHVRQVNHFYQRLLHSPDLAAYRRDAGRSLQRARRETGFQPGRGIFLSAFDFSGGVGPEPYAFKCEKRLATWIYGGLSANPRMAAEFRIDPFPPEGDYELVVCGQDDDAPAQCRIRITVNGKTIFEGRNPFIRFGWSRHAFRIPAACLRRNNRLRIENLHPDGAAGGPPFFMLNYAVIRPRR